MSPLARKFLGASLARSILSGSLARSMLGACLALSVIAGCERGNEAVTADDPATLGVIGARVHAEPERSDAILAEHGLTEAEFDERVWEVAEDPDAAARYTSAMEAELERLAVDRNAVDPR